MKSKKINLLKSVNITNFKCTRSVFAEKLKHAIFFGVCVSSLILAGCHANDDGKMNSLVVSDINSATQTTSSISSQTSTTTSALTTTTTESTTTTTKKKTTTSSKTSKTSTSTTRKITSSTTKDSSGIVFEDETASVLVDKIGFVPIREAYEKGYIRIKIINGIAYRLNTMDGVDYISDADPDTGISYDGESPIVYTYEDGTTGTEKRDGATYEYLPGLYRKIHLPKDDAGRLINTICPSCNKKIGKDNYPNSCVHFLFPQYCNYCGLFVDANTCHTCKSKPDSYTFCSHCGKEADDGTNGTCLRFWGIGDHECYNCGENVLSNTCHTCTRGCKYCNKPFGDGTNGTCYRYYFNSSKCPSCGVNVPLDTCHSCK